MQKQDTTLGRMCVKIIFMAWISRYGLPTVPNIQAFFLSYMVKFQDTETCVKENKETGIVVFNNSCFGDIRTSWINNEPFFCLADVCRSLELDNPSCVTTRLDKKGYSYYIYPYNRRKTKNAVHKRAESL